MMTTILISIQIGNTTNFIHSFMLSQHWNESPKNRIELFGVDNRIIENVITILNLYH